MSAVRRMKFGMCAAGVSYLMVVGYAQAQEQARERIKPVQFADGDTGRPLRDRRMERRDYEGQRTTTHFRGPDAAGSNAAGTNASVGVDNYLANCLAIHNQAEIELNQFAQDRLKSDDVKEFAGQMIKDHQQLGEKLTRVAKNQSDRDAALAQLLTIDRQISDKCGQMTRAKLEEASGEEFDKCFVGSQVGAHMQMLAALDVISSQANGELQQIAQDAKPTVEKHLKHAEKLLKELSSASDRSANRQARND